MYVTRTKQQIAGFYQGPVYDVLHENRDVDHSYLFLFIYINALN